jgi:hypothetical protein
MEQAGEHGTDLEDVSVGIGYELIRGHSTFGLTVGVMSGIPVGHNGEWELQPSIVAAKSFKRVQVHASIVGEIEKSQSLSASTWHPSAGSADIGTR